MSSSPLIGGGGPGLSYLSLRDAASTNTTAAYPPSFYEENRNDWVLVPAAVFTVICPLLVGLRFWSRMKTSGLIGVDDWTCLASLILTLVTNALFIAMVHYGFGHHIKSLTNDNRITALCLYWVSQMTYKMGLQLTKISLVLLYMRIFGTVTWFRRVCQFMITLLTLYALASCLTGLVQCNPIPKAWNSGLSGSCINLMQFFIFNGAMALATDAIILLLPLPMIVNLQVPLLQKLALIPVFGLGIFVVVISAWRLYALVATPSADTTYDLMGTLWTIIEYNVGLVCASLPTVRVFLANLFPRTFRSQNRTKGTGGSKGSFGTKHSTSGWSRVDGKDDVMLTSVSANKATDAGSEEHILEHKSIQKTVRYDVEYGQAR
ncbi:hypothetical protein GQ53DRAFT_837275 [Thozetella sp. PMI_491]|nr:hypothetical protein GQ53DRAFT_837275 [Thozetella sp. PMI_491]